MKLVIVESYNKIKSIKKFLGDDYEVVASGGHVRELKRTGYGFNRDTMIPIWELYNEKSKNNKTNAEKVISQIKSAARDAEKIYLATDPDREGEAISWHLFDLFDKKSQGKCQRITFNEITKKAIDNAISNPRNIDLNLVQSQWTRRILDRIVGYGLSSLVNAKLNAISAGRVQSVALLFIVERYLQIQNFVPEHWWTIQTFLKGKDKNGIEIFLRVPSFECESYGPKSSTEMCFAKEEDAKKCLDMLGDKFKVYKIDEPQLCYSKPYTPFQTDTLLTAAYTQLGWSANRTQAVAQDLYNGININGEVTSLISYPRTDTNRLNVDFIASTRDYIKKEFGDDYVSMNVKDATTGPLVQGAHEGIRPIDINIAPKLLEGKVNEKNANDLIKLYTLIWTRTVSSFMKVPIYKEHIIRFVNNDQKFYTSYKRLHFKGYYALPHWDKKNIDSNIDLSYLKEGDELSALKEPKIVEHESKPKPLFNEGSLVKELKKSGVGRPSTYATMVNVVRKRGYVEPGKELTPTKIGISLIENLTKEFSDFISKEFTASMELELDNIADGKQDWNAWIKNFKKTFDNRLGEAKQSMQKVPDEEVGRNCPDCNRPLIYRTNRRDRSKFIGCSGYKEGCRYTESLKQKPAATILEEKCPSCGKNLIERHSRRNEQFVGCTGFPSCKYTRSLKNLDKASDSSKESSKNIN